jgi:hypothetical protein
MHKPSQQCQTISNQIRKLQFLRNTWSTKGMLFIAALAFACTAQAPSLHREGDDLYASGVIRVGDDLALRQAAEQAPIRRLVLLNSPGGALMGAEPAQQ